jgi:Predicted transcription regulator containing HTH domain
LRKWRGLIKHADAEQALKPWFREACNANWKNPVQRGLSRRDLKPFIGSRARVAEILNHETPNTANDSAVYIKD